MNINILLGAQILSMTVYIGTVFFLYRLLVNQKDSTIEIKNSTIEQLKQQISVLEVNNPDLLIIRLKQRMQILEDELKKLHNDKSVDETLVQNLTEEKERMHKELEEVNKQLSVAMNNVIEILNETERANNRIDKILFCPHCRAMALEINFKDRSSSYECGLINKNGLAIQQCSKI